MDTRLSFPPPHHRAIIREPGYEAICLVCNQRYAIARYTIDNRDTIADRDTVADAGAPADSDPPVVVLHSSFRRRAHACTNRLQCGVLYSYNIPSFSVITVEMRRIKYQIGHHDGSNKLWMDSFMPSRRVLGIHSLYLQTAG